MESIEKLIVKLNAEHIVRQNVEAENAKLRGLIRDLYDNLWTHKPKCAEAFADRMRELGIEVDE